MSAPPSTMPAPASAARAEPARPPAAEALLSQYAAWLAARGRGNRCFADGAAGFLRRWPDPQSFAAEPLEVMLAQDQQTRPFITFLLLHDLLRPGYDYLAERKFASLVELARGTRLEPGLDGYQHAAAELGFSPHVCSRSAERVIIRLLIQTGRPLHDLTVTDLRDAEAAFRARGERRNGDWSNDRGFLHAAWAVLFHLGIVERDAAEPAPTRARRPCAPLRRRPGLAGRPVRGLHLGDLRHPRVLDDGGHRDPAGPLRPAPGRRRPGPGLPRRAGPAASHRDLPGRDRRRHGPARRAAHRRRGAAEPDHHPRPVPRRHRRMGMARRARPAARVHPRHPETPAAAAPLPARRRRPAHRRGPGGLAEPAVRRRAPARPRHRAAHRRAASTSNSTASTRSPAPAPG